MTLIELLRETDEDEIIMTISDYIGYGEDYMWNDEIIANRYLFICEWVEVFCIDNEEDLSIEEFLERLRYDEIDFERAAEWIQVNSAHDPDYMLDVE